MYKKYIFSFVLISIIYISLIGCVFAITDRLDINTCSKIDLLEVYGVGEEIANDIIANRPYHKLIEVKYNCKTIGNKRYNDIILLNFKI